MTNQEAKILIKKTMPKGNSAIEIQLRAALEQAVSVLGAIEQYKWERDVAIGQLRELGLELGLKTDEVKKAISIYKKLPGVIEDLKKEVYRIDDSATLSSKDVINEEDVFEVLESLLP